MNKRGQALVEFIIILPIFLLLVLGVIDMGNIIISRIEMEKDLSEIVSLYQNDIEVSDISKKLNLNDDKTLEIKENDEFLEILLVKKINIITPGLNLILKNPYNLKISRSVLNDS